jgi:hypothetical protein
MAIWKWAKEHGGIDEGMPIEKVKDAINQQFFAGSAKDEWLNDILAGRKSPLRQVSDAAWKAQYNRRLVTQQARMLTKTRSIGPIAKIAHWAYSVPRTMITFGHGTVFPITHGGDLLFRPASWGTWFRDTAMLYHKMWSAGATDRMLDGMKRDANYRLAMDSKLDIGDNIHQSGILDPNLGKHPLGRLMEAINAPSVHAWDLMKVMRYDLWNEAMKNHIKSGMSQQEIGDIGKNLADWANHATGSTKMSIPYAGEALFGPKLTASKWARLIADPAKTVNTFARMALDPGNVSVGERAVARQRLSGSLQYLGTFLGMLSANQALLAMTHGKNLMNDPLNSKDDPDLINFLHPIKDGKIASDWLSFKWGGMRFGIPGMLSEIRILGRIAAVSTLDRQSPAGKKFLEGKSKNAAIAELVGEYGMGKLHPSAKLGLETLAQERGFGYFKEPLPWSRDIGTKTMPRLAWPEYLSESLLPIPLQGPAKTLWESMRKNGASVPDAGAMTRAIMEGSLGMTGLEAKEDYSKTPLRTRGGRVRIGH